MYKKLPLVKKICVPLALVGFALLIFALIMLPLRVVDAPWHTVPALIGGVLIVGVIPFMWKDGIANLKTKPKTPHLLRMRQSGFFDLLVLIAILAIVLAVLGTIGTISYNAKEQSFFENAAAAANAALPEGAESVAVPKTIEEARGLETFIEYNFKQSLNFLDKGRKTMLGAALLLLIVTAVCFLYMRFVSPIVQADEYLQIAHRIYSAVAQYACAILLVIVVLFPIYWMIISSFKTSDELLQAVPTLWPKQFIFANYPQVLNKAPFGRYLINTLITTVGIMIGELTLGVMAAYGFSKGDFKGKNTLFLLVLGALMVPIQVTFVPIYVMIARMGIMDTWWGVIVPNLMSAYFIFMLRQNFMAVDDSYIEAGRIDGMGRFGAIIHVLCPMCKPTLITVSIISFINGWNSYFWPKMVTKSEASRTIAVGVQRLKETFAGQYVSNYNEIMAGAVMAIIPIVALFLILQKYIMTGMSKAAMK